MRIQGAPAASDSLVPDADVLGLVHAFNRGGFTNAVTANVQ